MGGEDGRIGGWEGRGAVLLSSYQRGETRCDARSPVRHGTTAGKRVYVRA